MSDESMRTALRGLRVRIPESADDAARLRAEVQAADAAVGEWLRARTAERLLAREAHDDRGRS
ncbi:hypothetical protein [Streptomyces sp. AC495_CC817]|uniref:hypothetical protein n=1 Tax=Streptomyces sp. AC495_CC817 TaxID=2823900 RepID=UPI001C27ADB0|nr:hypothetical protein [Streptomyces sp. AC495_CC817]